MRSTKGEAGAVVQSDEFYDAMDRAGTCIYTPTRRGWWNQCALSVLCVCVCVCVCVCGESLIRGSKIAQLHNHRNGSVAPVQGILIYHDVIGAGAPPSSDPAARLDFEAELRGIARNGARPVTRLAKSWIWI